MTRSSACDGARVPTTGASLPSISSARTLFRQALPHLIEGLVGPSAAFLLGRHWFGLVGAIGFAFFWAAGCMAVRVARGARISGLLVVAMITVVLRTVAGLVAHSSRAYFIGPDIATAGMGLAFVVSALAGRPLISRVLADLIPAEWFDPLRPEASRLCRLASYAWGFEQVLVSVVTAFMVFHLDTTTYVTIHEPVSLAVFGIVIAAALPLLLPEVRAVRRHGRTPEAGGDAGTEVAATAEPGLLPAG
jgi:hypothetical protein